MQDVNIYIAGTIHGPAKKAGGYLYILECFRDGQAVTAIIFVMARSSIN